MIILFWKELAMNKDKATLLILYSITLIVLSGIAYSSFDILTGPASQAWEQMARRGSDDFGFDDSRGRNRGRDHLEDSGRHRSGDDHSDFDDSGRHGGRG